MTTQLVYQRIRNRIIELLEQLVECETSPPELGMNELINSWDDWVPSPLVEGYFPPPVFTNSEQNVIRRTSVAIDEFCEVTPKSIEDDRAVLRLPRWALVIETSKLALSTMMERGKMSEDEEIQL
jgi:hypothetical protein